MRELLRTEERAQANAVLCGMPLTEWQALPRRERKRRTDEGRIVAALREAGEMSGFPLIEATGLGSGRLYITLARMENGGRGVSRWADGPYPRRRLYRLPGAPVKEETDRG